MTNDRNVSPPRFIDHSLKALDVLRIGPIELAHPVVLAA